MTASLTFDNGAEVSEGDTVRVTINGLDEQAELDIGGYYHRKRDTELAVRVGDKTVGKLYEGAPTGCWDDDVIATLNFDGVHEVTDIVVQ